MTDPSIFCEQTRKAYDGLITKPPLTDKLLSKPPFRFIHDVVSAIISNTGYLKDVYTPDELDSSQVKDKDAKIAFLQKAISNVEATTGQKVDVKPGKIVAGHEPEKTNVFLQKLALAAKGGDMNVSGGSAGSNKENRDSKTDSGADKSKPSKPTKPDKEEAKKPHKVRSESKEKDKKSTKKEPSDKKERSSSRDKDKSGKDKKSSSKHRTSSKEKTDKPSDKPKEKPSKSHSEEKLKTKTSTHSKEKTSKDKVSKEKSPKTGTKKVKSSSIEREKTDIHLIPNGTVNKDNSNVFDSFNTDQLTPRSPRKESSGDSLLQSHKDTSDSLNQSAHKQTANDNQEEIRPGSSRPNRSSVPPGGRPGSSMGRPGSSMARPGTSMARPGTSMARPGTAMARAAPPKLKRKELGEVEQPKTIESTEVKPTSNIIGGEMDDDNDEDAFVMEEHTAGHDYEQDNMDMVDADQLDAAEHGGLVRKILETKKELETGLESDGRRDKGVSVFDEKERERTIKEAKKLQEQVQAMTRSAHPLGRLIDFLQEDIDSMIKELEEWRLESKTNMTQLKQNQGGSISDMDPLKAKLQELDSKIGEKRDAIVNVKATIISNNIKIKSQV